MSAKRLLVVDDHRAVAGIVRCAATRLGFDVQVAFDGIEFMDRFVNFAPDVVVLDIVMPDLDGFDLIRFLVEQKFASHLVLVSGHDPLFLKAAKLVAADHGIASVTALPKPFGLEQIEAVLRPFL
jgi:DNA-binding response OmpR family regulator